jgi:TonB-linked SusC/RagA family outer membrane protein
MHSIRRTLVTLALTTFAPLAQLAAQGSIAGRVTDSATAQPVTGVRVTVAGSASGMLTDREGRYLLSGLAPGVVTVRAQRIGYGQREQTVTVLEGGTVTLDFALRAAATVLTEQVVTGYGTDDRATLSSAVASVSAEKLQNVPLAGIDAAMQGQAAGVQVIQNAGNPGVGMTVRIRGAASISASNQPLYVIDGVPLIRDDFSQLDVGGQDITGVTGINPDEVERIDILKDASAAAIYGSRGSNGVVMITTKRGRAGRTNFSFSTYGGSQTVPKGNRWDMMNANEYMTYMNEAAENDDYGALYFGDPSTVGVGTDWQGEVFRAAPIRNFTVGINGGNERIQYFVSGSQFKQEGVVIGSGYHRESGRVNLDLTASDRLHFRSSLSVSREEHQRIENDNSIAGVVTNAIANQPFYPTTLGDGSFTTTDFCSPNMCLAYENPLAIATYDLTESRGLRVLGSIEANFALSPTVALNGRFGLDVLNLRDLRWFSPLVGGSYGESVGGESIMGNNTPNRYIVEGFAEFTPRMSPALALSVTGGASAEWNNSELDYLDGISFPGDRMQYPGNAAQIVAYDGGWDGHNLVSFFTRANAVFKERYLFTGSLRADGSSRFGADNRWGTFPAFSFGWKITDEPFMQGLSRVADVKLRVSYGITGNQDLNDNFAPLSRFGRANYADNAGWGQTNLGNSSLHWERTSESNIGADIGIFGGRASVIVDWYKKQTDALLLRLPVSATSGQTLVWSNVGTIENRGLELTLSAQLLRSSEAHGFSWTSDFNISWNHNEVTALFQDEPITTGLYNTSRIEVGHPLSGFYTIRFLGVDPATGDAIYDDINNDGTIDAADRVFIGSPHPKYWGGITNTLTWGNFDFRSFLQFTQGHTIFNAIGVFANDGGYNWDNKFRRLLDRWQQPGDVTNEPRASYDGTSGASEISSRNFENGSYIRLQELTVGYKLPLALSQALRLNDSRIYFSGRNLQTWTKYTGYSPDVNSNGSSSNTALATEFYAYPLARTIMIGISGAF